MVKRELVGKTDGLDARNIANAAEHFFEDAGAFCTVPAVVEVDAEGCGVGGLEAEVDVEDVEKAAEKQAGADEQDTGEGNL
jgi:hypothetical protein